MHRGQALMAFLSLLLLPAIRCATTEAAIARLVPDLAVPEPETDGPDLPDNFPAPHRPLFCACWEPDSDEWEMEYPSLFPPAPSLPTPLKKKVVVHGGSFDANAATIRPEAVPVLHEAAQALSGRGAVVVVVHAPDGPGNTAYRSILARRRAKAVRHFLIGHGIAARRIAIEGLDPLRLTSPHDNTLGSRTQKCPAELHVE